MNSRKRFLKYALLLVVLTLFLFLIPARNISRAVGTQTSTPTVAASTINSQNAGKVRLLAQLGHGQAIDIAWTPDGKQMLVISTAGIWIYETADLRKAPRHIDAGSASRVIFNVDKTLIA